jgi:hypothetical protein
MDRYEGLLTALNINLHRGLYLAITMDRYVETITALTIPLHRGLNGPLWGAPNLP